MPRYVYISLKELGRISDCERRAVYVGITRAKDNLSVHYDNADIFTDEYFRRMTVLDKTDYGAPDEVLLQLSHRDVVLDVFKGRGELISPLYSGTPLCADENCLYHESADRRRLVVKFSSAFRSKLSRLEAKGYSLQEAKVRFQIYWRYDVTSGTSSEPQWREVLVMLPS